MILGAFTTLRKAYVNFIMSIRPHGATRSGRFFVKFCNFFFTITVDKFYVFIHLGGEILLQCRAVVKK